MLFCSRCLFQLAESKGIFGVLKNSNTLCGFSPEFLTSSCIIITEKARLYFPPSLPCRLPQQIKGQHLLPLSFQHYPLLAGRMCLLSKPCQALLNFPYNSQSRQNAWHMRKLFLHHFSLTQSPLPPMFFRCLIYHQLISSSFLQHLPQHDKPLPSPRLSFSCQLWLYLCYCLSFWQMPLSFLQSRCQEQQQSGFLLSQDALSLCTPQHQDSFKEHQKEY